MSKNQKEVMPLNQLKPGQQAVIHQIKGNTRFRKRLLEMGFTTGTKIYIEKFAPLGDPGEYVIKDSHISLRNSDAHEVLLTGVEALELGSKQLKRIVVGLAGNPNSGKTSIFNNLTGSHQHVGNYPGVTVEKREGTIIYENYELVIVDLPGCYSLSPYSPEEIAARNFIIHEQPDVIVNVVDASNLERNLYLTTQLIDLKVHMVLALNMIDVAHKRNIKIKQKALGQLLGAPVVPTIGRAKQGIEELLAAVVKVAEDPDDVTRHIDINYGSEVEEEISKIERIVIQDQKLCAGPHNHRWLAIRCIEGDSNVLHYIRQKASEPELILNSMSGSKEHLESIFAETIDSIIADRIYSFLHGLCLEVIDKERQVRITHSDKIDRILTNKVLGFPVFFGLMWIMFQTTFTLAEAPMSWLETLMQSIKGIVEANLAAGPLRSLISGGIIDGVGGVVIFLPNILILFFFLALLDDTGYMARAAFLMDRVMHKLGLHGKSFISMLIGFGCNVPGIMATRTLENRQDRLITILINPLMSCSARYPVYVLFGAAFFKNNQALVILSIYILGMLLAIAMGKLFRKTLFKEESSPFVLELPPYRIPTLNSIIIHMWDQGKLFLKKAGGIILIGTIFVWFISQYPADDQLTLSRNYKSEIAKTRQAGKTELTKLQTTYNAAIAAARQEHDKTAKADKIRQFVGFTQHPIFIKLQNIYLKKKQHLESIHDSLRKELETKRKMELISQKYAGRIGTAIEPLLKPLGFDWRLGISLIPGFTAKEIVVSSLGVIFGAGEIDDGAASVGSIVSLRQKLRNSYSPLIAYCFMVFTLIYTPCMATVAIIRRETGGWIWPLFSIGYSLVLAWVVTFLFYQIGLLLGFG